jgi:hypothetical protein
MHAVHTRTVVSALLLLQRGPCSSPFSSTDACCALAAEVFFHQLVQVLTALLGATYPCPDAGASASTSTSSTTPGGSSSSNSSSRPGVSLQQVAAVALAWEQVCGLLTSFALASEPVSGRVWVARPVCQL